MRRTLLLILVLMLACAGQASASADDVLRDCTDDGRLQGSYSQQELRQAIATIPSDVDEYTNCRDVIKAAQLSGAGGAGAGGDENGGTGPGAGEENGATGDDGGGGTGETGLGGDAGGADAGDASGTATGTGSAGDKGAENPPTGSATGDFGGFSGFERDPLRAAAAEERDAIEEAIASRPPAVARGAGPFADTDLPTALWVVLALGAAGLIALAASDLRRRVVARRAV